MRTLLVGVLALGLVVSIVGCGEPNQKPGTTPKVDAGKATPAKGAGTVTTTTTSKTVATTTTTATAMTVSFKPAASAATIVAGKAVEGKFVLRVDCGSGQATTDTAGVTWSKDQAYNANNKYGYTGGDNGNHPVTGLAPQYGTEHWGMSSYKFDVPNGKYLVRLHFVEIYPTKVTKEGIRTFTVGLQGKPVLEKFDIVKASGGVYTPIVKELKADVTDGKLVIDFTKIGDEFPTIEALEVLGQ
jgi:hypothetical protein